MDGDARLSNLLLTMLQRVDVKAEKFQDSVASRFPGYWLDGGIGW